MEPQYTLLPFYDVITATKLFAVFTLLLIITIVVKKIVKGVCLYEKIYSTSIRRIF